jgi:N-acetylneuraminate lyase
MQNRRLSGLIAATYSPVTADGSVDVSAIAAMVDRLTADRIGGLFIGGSTGEGMSLSSTQRRKLAEAFIDAAAGSLPVIVHVGHNSLAEAAELAAHAGQAGATAISATCPSYFRITREEVLVECMAEIARAAGELPFYYYHIPVMTGSRLNMVRFLELAETQIPNLAGLKFTDTRLHEFQSCLELEEGRYDVVWGCDEMLLGAWAVGARAAIGSTYNFMPKVYQNLIAAFEKGDLAGARRYQSFAIKAIEVIARFPFHPAVKAIFNMQGLDLGDCRLPQPKLDRDQVNALRQQLEAIDFFDKINCGEGE